MKNLITKITSLTICCLFLASFANGQAQYDVFIGNNGFTPSSLSVNVGDYVNFKLDLANNSGSHTSSSTNIPNGSPAWNYTVYCNTCKYTVIVTQPGTYEYVDGTSGQTGTFSTTITGLKEADVKPTSLNIYPNPVQGRSVISYKLNSNEGQIVIVNTLGEEVSVYQLTSRSGKESINADLSKGLYFCILRENGSMVNRSKMIVVD